MIQEFYGLELDAFSLSPDLDFLFLSHVHEEAVAHLIYGLENNEDIILIVGDIGTGKTLALHRLITQVSNAFIPVSINVTTIDFEQFLRLVLLKLGSDPQADSSLASLIHAFEKTLISIRNKGRKVLLVVDEAQNLSMESLEAIRLLMNLAQPGGQALQLVLAGQLGLRSNLDSSGMRQLRQRIRVDYQLGFLNREEIEDYIVHRLKTSGRTDPLFDKKALDRIYSLSRGVPRVVNILASKALLAGYVEGAKKISSRHLDEIEAEDLLETPKPDPAIPEVPLSKPAETSPEPEVIPLRAQKAKPVEPSPEPEVNPVRGPEIQNPEPIRSDAYETKSSRGKGNKRGLIWTVSLLAVIVAAVSITIWGPGLSFDFLDKGGSEVSRGPVPTQPYSSSATSPPVLPAQAPDQSLGLADSVAVAEPVELIPEETVTSDPNDEGDEEIDATAETKVEAVPVPPPSVHQKPIESENRYLSDRGDEVFLDGGDKGLANNNNDKFLVHVASFLLIERGVNFSTQLKRRGVEAFVRPSTSSGGKTWYRVYIGPFPNQQKAMEVAEEYKENGWIEYTRIAIPEPEWGSL